MDYKLHYNNLMEKVKNRKLSNDVYKERHHIIPKCLGGGNGKDNIVELLPREHYIAHLLLFKIYPNNQKLSYAFWMMCNGYKKDIRGYVVSGRIYEEIRNKFIKMVKEREPTFKGKRHTEESKQKNRESHLGRKVWLGKRHTEESKQKMSEYHTGKKLSEETKKKMSEYHTGKKLSEETKKKMSESAMGDKNNYKRYLERTGLPHVGSKPIKQYSLEGEFIREWVNAHVASKELGLSYKAINGCLNGKSKTSQGYVWVYVI